MPVGRGLMRNGYWVKRKGYDVPNTTKNYKTFLSFKFLITKKSYFIVRVFIVMFLYCIVFNCVAEYDPPNITLQLNHAKVPEAVSRQLLTLGR